MDIEEEIARTLAAWWYDPDGGTDAEVDVFRPDAAALMPLVKRAQAEAWADAIASMHARVGADGMLDQHRLIRMANPYIDEEVSDGE